MDARLVDPERWLSWDRFVAAAPASGFMQSSWWARFREPLGFEHFGVTLKHEGAIVGGALVAKWQFAPRRCFYYIQDGPLLPDDEAFAGEVFEAILQRIEQHRRADTDRVSHLRIEPRWLERPAFLRGFDAPDFADVYREPRRTLCLDLRMPDDALLAQMKPKGRYNIRVAQRHGVAVVQDNSETGLADFLRIYRRTTARHGIGAKPPSYFRALVAAASPPASLLFAEVRGRRIATALVVQFGRRASYFYGGSLMLHRNAMAPYLLHFEAARRVRAAGCEWYDLWGVAPPDRPDHKWHQISEFKRKFGGVEFDFGPTLDRVYDAAAYARFRDLQLASQRAEARRTPAAPTPRVAKATRPATAAPGADAAERCTTPERRGTPMSPPGRPKGEYRSAQHESTPVSRRAAPRANTEALQREGTSVSTSLDEIKLFEHAVPSRRFAELGRVFPSEHFERLSAEGFHFYRTTFWYPLARPAQNIFEAIVDALKPSADPAPEVTGAEWWFSVMHTNTTPQWLLPCHFDRNDLAEQDTSKLKHPDKASVLFLNAVPYGELAITDQVLTDRGARPRQPQAMRFIRPRRNLYAVFPGHLYHGVIGRMWRPPKHSALRVTMAVNWWREPPTAAYLGDSRDSLAAFGLAA